MLVYSAKSKRVYENLLHPTVMSSSQKEQLHNNFKKYAIQQFKEASKMTIFDGSGIFSKKRLRIYFDSWYFSPTFKNTTISKKMGHVSTVLDDEKLAIMKKAATLLRKAGYKVDIEGGILYMYKPSKKR